jgi:RNA polymerase sigma factor (sigma-70 family)
MGMLSSSRTLADSSAFAKIVDGHHAEIHRYLRRVAPHRADADVLCEETFVRAFHAHRSLTADVDVRAWLFAIATRLCRTPRSARGSSPGKLESAQPYAADGRTREGEACALRTWSPLERAIGRLAVAQRLALAMRKLHHLDYAAIGACLDCSAETARTLVLEAMRKIRHGLEAFPAGAGWSANGPTTTQAPRDPRIAYAFPTTGSSHRGSDDRRDDSGRSTRSDHTRGSRAGLG